MPYRHMTRRDQLICEENTSALPVMSDVMPSKRDQEKCKQLSMTSQ
jgi:hypothetical protein